MAPHGDSITGSFAKKPPPPPRLSKESLLRTKSDITSQFSKDTVDEEATVMEFSSLLPPISEVEDAKCECCGMCEEYTAEYIDKVRARYSGKWICGLCAEAVKEEMERHGGGMREDEALRLHMSACARFKQIRAFPALYQADAMRQILKKGTTLRAKSLSPRDKETGGCQKKGMIMRSSSCMPALTRELKELSLSNN
ncbi:hypothetical protein MLD38_004866 [Melastoma candidum]|uniref:Uncharacterized protein n=1 Tax=Melastoma candidum TaxID=119954 RepID=A0ACB9S6Y6_9MYRT|nr:hypothetical protein MLD38_004866 [Melastoma candidum]